MRKISKKRAIQNKEYLKLRGEFLEDNPYCEVCGKPAHEIHHKRGRFADRLTDVNYFMSVCRMCHTDIHLNPQQSRDKGYIL